MKKLKKTVIKEAEEKRDENYNLKIIARGGMIALIGLFFGKIIGYLYTILVSKFGPADYGLLSLALVIVTFIAAFSTFGLGEGVLRYISYYLEKKDKKRIKGGLVFSIKFSLILSIVLTILLLIFAKQISINIFHKPELTNLLMILALMIPFLTISNIFFPIFRAIKRIEFETGLKEIAEKLIRLVIFIPLFFLGFGVMGATFSYLVAAIAVFFIGLFLLNKYFIKPLDIIKIKPIYYNREIMDYSFPLLLSVMLVSIIAWADVLMIGFFKTALETGIYNIALGTAQLIIILPFALSSLFSPVLIGLFAKRKNLEIKNIYKRMCKWMFILNLPAFLILFLFSEKFLEIIFGTQFIPSSIPLSILCVGYFIYTMTYPSATFFILKKKTKTLFYITLTFAILNILLNLILIPPYGINGAAIATSSSFLIAGILYMILSYKYARTIPFTKSFFFMLLIGLLSALVIFGLGNMFFPTLSTIPFVIMSVIFIAFYFSLILFFKILDKEDKYILNIFKLKIIKLLKQKK